MNTNRERDRGGRGEGPPEGVPLGERRSAGSTVLTVPRPMRVNSGPDQQAPPPQGQQPPAGMQASGAPGITLQVGCSSLHISTVMQMSQLCKTVHASVCSKPVSAMGSYQGLEAANCTSQLVLAIIACCQLDYRTSSQPLTGYTL